MRYCSCWLIFIISLIVGPLASSDTVTAQERIGLSAATDSTAQDSSRTQPADPWLGADKFKHIALSAYLLGVQMYVYQQPLGLDERRALGLAVTGTAVIGIGKEIYDGVSGRGQASVKDLAADLLGIALGSLLFLID